MENLKNVILFVPSYETGGVERNATIFANMMVDNKYAVSLMYNRSKSGWFDKLDPQIKKIKVGFQLYPPGLNPRIFDAMYMLIFGLFRLYAFKRANCSAVVAFQSNVIAIILAKLVGLPIVVRLSNHYTSVEVDRSLLRRCSEWGKKKLYRYANVVIANSEELAVDYSSVLERQVEVICNPIDFKYVREKSKEVVDAPLFLNKSRPIVISVGRLVKQKNITLLLKAFAQVVKNKECDLVIVGDGDERILLENITEELGLTPFVHFLGYQKNPYKYLNKCDLYVLSSDYEGMPNSLIEAIACEVPVVATDCKTGPKEILDFGKSGLLCPCGDVESLANAILTMLTDSEQYNLFKQLSFDRVQKYKYSKIESEYLSMINKLFGDKQIA